LTKVSCPTGIDAWLVTRYDDAREVLSDSQRFSCSSGQAGHVLDIFARDSPVNEGEFFHMDGPDHVRFRQVFAPAISTIKRIELFRPMIRRTVDELLDGLATATEPVDLHERFSKPLTSTVIAELLDVPHEDRALFHRVAEATFNSNTDAGELDEVRSPLLEYVHGLVTKRRTMPGEDALSIMVDRGQDADSPFTDTELTTMAASLLVAGYDTTASMITFGTLALLDNPEQFALLREDPSTVPAAVEEIVRLLGAGAGQLRVARVDTEISGTPIASGDFVVVAIQAANHDPAQFSDPEHLDITRQPNRHIGFGYGPHQCVGQQIARLELSTVLAVLPRRVPSLRLAVRLEDIEFKTNTVVLGPAALPVSWDQVLPAE